MAIFFCFQLLFVTFASEEGKVPRVITSVPDVPQMKQEQLLSLRYNNG